MKDNGPRMIHSTKELLKLGRDRTKTRKARIQDQINKSKPHSPAAVKADYNL